MMAPGYGVEVYRILMVTGGWDPYSVTIPLPGYFMSSEQKTFTILITAKANS